MGIMLMVGMHMPHVGLHRAQQQSTDACSLDAGIGVQLNGTLYVTIACDAPEQHCCSAEYLAGLRYITTSDPCRHAASMHASTIEVRGQALVLVALMKVL